MLAYLTAGTVSFLYIALKALQQRQVMAAQYWRMPLISFGMAFCEVFVVSNVALRAENHTSLVALAVAIGAGGGAGSIFGTWLHARKR